tara:strand:- start:687 stop:1223 length:537 start_codon:yes stop_codon:yes gene_type:complete
MTAIIESPRNYIIRDVQLNWARLDKPVIPFGTPQYEMQIATTSKAVAAEWSANYLRVKEKDGVFSVGLKRKAFKQDGKDNGKPKVVTADLQPLSEGIMIGNGSIGNVRVYQFPYDVAGSKGTGSSLTAIQVTTLIEYAGGSANDFVAIESETPVPSKAPAASGTPAAPSDSMETGDIF